MEAGGTLPPKEPFGRSIFTIPRRFLRRYDLMLLVFSILMLFIWPNLWRNLTASGYMPHGHCYFWIPELVSLHLVSDILIGLSYTAISATLTYLVYRARRDMPFHWVFLAFGLFIVACGMTHWMEVWTIWHATYWLSGYVKLVTAVASVATAVVLPPLVPRTLAMIHAAKLSEERKADMALANKELEELRRREQRRAEESISQLAAIVESSEDAILGETLDGIITSWNKGAEKIYGYTAEEATGKPLSIIIPPERLQQMRESLEKVGRGEKVPPFETIHVAKSGKQIDVSVTISPVKDGAGRVVGASNISRDITERRRTEEALRQGEKRLQLVTDHAPVLITYCSADRRYRFVNKPYAERFGMHPSEFVDKAFHEVMGQDAYKAIEPYVDEVLQGRRVEFETEIPYRDLGTRHMWAAYEPELDDRGSVTGFVSAIIDITERKRAEAALGESEERFAKAFEASPLAMTITSLKTGRLLEVNETFTRMSGYTADEATGRTTIELGLWAKPADREAELATLSQVGQVRDAEYRFRIKGGKELIGRLSAERIPIGGEPCALTVIQDVTEQKRVEAEREQLLEREKALRARAEEANRLKDEFLATVSHELRTPLTAIMGWSHMLEKKRLDPEAARHAIGVISRSAEQQRQIVEDLLDVSSIITGKLKLESEPLEVAEVVQAALDTVKHAADAKGIRLWSSLNQEVLITGDPARLRQVVWNLLSNAVKFTPQGGEVRVSVERGTTHALLEVTDTGQGITAEFLPYVFDRFSQADSSTTRKHGGLGLGLSIVRHLVELHGGSVQAESAGEGSGATFTVELPLLAEGELTVGQELKHEELSKSPPPVSKDEKGSPSTSLAGLRVLLVDDDGDTLEMLSVFLRGCGAEVYAASSGKAALGLLEQIKPDVIVADIGMPGMDGHELIRMVRSEKAEMDVEVPAIALTAYASEADRRRALDSGFQAHLAKPVEPEALVAMIVDLIIT